MLAELAGKRVLLLQGPMSPFFGRLARELTLNGSVVTKVNFNAGDELFFAGANTVAFRDELSSWPGFVRDLLVGRRIDAMVLFGDCRPLHRRAGEVARDLGVQTYVFEEGYLRPSYITIERGGVNGSSSVPREPSVFRALPPVRQREVRVGPNGFYLSAIYASLYAVACAAGRRRFPHYEHHKDLGLGYQARSWWKGTLRRVKYAVSERSIAERLAGEFDQRYFLVALQVHNDFQIKNSRFDSVGDFVDEVVRSFAAHAPADRHLVIKHHPLDRAYSDYTVHLASLTRELKLEGRVHYVHDLHLPTLLRHALGTVVINSTVGLQSLLSGTPIIALSEAFYTIEGMVFAGSLAEFWCDPGAVDSELVMGFRDYLLAHNQANGSFYVRLPGARGPTGVHWGG